MDLPSTTRPSAFNPTSPSTAFSTSGGVNTADYEQYTYDANGNRTSFRKRDGQTIAYQYDVLNRDIPGGAVTDVYYGYNLRGSQIYARFGSSSGNGITNFYDGLGHLTSSINSTGGTARTLSYQYDADGNRTRLTFPDNQYVTFQYDAMERQTGMLENGTTAVVSLTYDALGRRAPGDADAWRGRFKRELWL